MHRKRPLILIVIIVVILAAFIYKTAGVYPFLFQLIFNRGVILKQTTDNRINILLLGIGDLNHDGTNLTDTIMLASLDPKNNKVTLVSIPRDLWFPDLTMNVKKINGAYAYGEAVKKGGGLALAEAAIGKITGQQIDYGVRIDFSGFVKAVDLVGGLDITVDNTFDDYQYPIDGKEVDTCGHTPEEMKSLADTPEDRLPQAFPCRYLHLHFNKGLNHMDGVTALEFVRSRHATGLENGDFARSKRQEKVIAAFKSKVLSAQTLINPGKLISLYTTLQGSIDTDIKQDDFDDFIRLATKMRGAKIASTIIDIGDVMNNRAGLLDEAPFSDEYDNLSVLIPRTGNGNFTEIQNYISCEINKGNCSVLPTPTP
jgi:LCP family protein required for cell wall assembly